MTDRETTVLTSRLQSIADGMTPQLDVVAQVRAARARHRRQRRGRIAVATAAAAAAVVVVGSVAAADLLSAERRSGQVAGPSATAPASTSPTAPGTTTAAAPSDPLVPITSSAVPADTGGVVVPADSWEQRRFEGVTFDVPPGARAADTIDLSPISGFVDGPSLTWNGPELAGGEAAYVRVQVVGTYEGGLTPTDGGRYYDVPGADIAYGGIDSTSDTLVVWLNLVAGDRQIVVGAVLPGGLEGDQMAQRLVASIAVG